MGRENDVFWFENCRWVLNLNAYHLGGEYVCSVSVIAFDDRRTLSYLLKAGFFEILVNAKLAAQYIFQRHFSDEYRYHSRPCFRSHAQTPSGIERTLLMLQCCMEEVVFNSKTAGSELDFSKMPMQFNY